VSAEQEQARALAARIAARLGRDAAETDAPARDDDELASLRARLAELQQRLAHVEAHVTHTPDCAEHAAPPPRAHEPSPQTQEVAAQAQGARASQPAGWTSSTYIPVVSHPSQERFGVGEAVSELVDFFEREKICNVEPGGKPCDHCSMCSARGF
jgi:hypothetical protein